MLTTIANYKVTSDWYYIIVATILIDCVVLYLTRYPGPDPFFKVDALNKWYDEFGVVAAISDVLSLLIGIAAARYIYTAAGLQGSLLFIACILLFQLFHDIFFYVAVIRTLPQGENKMIDVFKSYAEENGAKILGADAAMLVASAFAAAFLKGVPFHYTVSVGLITIYAMSYLLYTRHTRGTRGV
jgi:hypothetical protein